MPYLRNKRCKEDVMKRSKPRRLKKGEEKEDEELRISRLFCCARASNKLKFGGKKRKGVCIKQKPEMSQYILLLLNFLFSSQKNT